MKKSLAVLLSVLLLLACLTGCGSDSAAAADNAAAESVIWEAAPAEEATELPEMETISTTAQELADEDLNVEEVQTYAEKIIYSGHVYLEVTLFDDAIRVLEQAVSSYGGFVEESSVNGSTAYNSDGSTSVVDRWGYYVVRVPADRFEEFMSLASGIGTVTSSSRTAENVTSQYTDYEARLTSLYTQEERLLAMLEESGDLDSLIQLEARLSEVRYEIESIERNLRDLEQKLAYSTVTLELQEVEIYTPTVTVKRTFGQKLGDALQDGWSGFVRGLQQFAVSLARSLPGVLLFALLIVAAVLLLRRIRRKRRAQKAETAEQQQTEA